MAVSTTYHLSQDDELGYTVAGGLARLDAGYLTGLDVTINGVKATVPEAGFQVFPGAYAVAVTTPSLTRAGDGRVVLGAPDADLALDALKPKLNDEGLQRFRALVAASVRRCLAETTGTKNGVHGSFSLLFGPSFRSASIDISQDEPTVEWG